MTQQELDEMDRLREKADRTPQEEERRRELFRRFVREELGYKHEEE